MSNRFDYSEDLIKLLSDDELKQTSEIAHTLRQKIDCFLKNTRGQTIKILEELKEEIEKSYDKSRKARIAGTTATVAGSAIAIVGFGLGFVTLGGSLGLTAVGAVLAVAGGVTLGGADLGYTAVSHKKLEETKKACHDDKAEMQGIETTGRELSDHIDSLVMKHPTFSKEVILSLLKHAWNSSKPVFRTFYDGYKLIDSASDIGRGAIRVTNAVRAGAQAGARTAYVGLSTAGRVFSIGSVVLDVIFIPIDIVVLAKSAHDVRKYKNGKGKSNSAAASKIRSILKDLNANSEELMRLRDQLPGEDDRVDLSDQAIF